MAKNPLSEVFGFPISNQGNKAQHFRLNKLCPFANIVPNCTKDKADDPLGVCSVNYEEDAIITCPVRFREDWLIIEKAAGFAFPKNSKWTSISEIKLTDADGKAAGNIDYVIIRLDDDGQVIDFASIEVQGVYISGNLRNAFKKYMQNPTDKFAWDGPNYPHPDYLSSSRKRLIPQMLSKGGIFKAWNKKQCIVIQEEFYETLPELPEVDEENAEVAWFLYRLIPNNNSGTLELTLSRTIYTKYKAALDVVTMARPGEIENFIALLQDKLAVKKQITPENPKPFNFK